MKSPIGILGGTFDPIHLGHIKIAKLALEKCGLHKIIFIPCNIPPHRYQPIATAAQRLAMVKIAIVPIKTSKIIDAITAIVAPHRKQRKIGIHFSRLYFSVFLIHTV